MAVLVQLTVTPATQQQFHELDAAVGLTSREEAAQRSGQVRWLARRDPLAALHELILAVEEHGATEIPDALLSAIGRAGRVDPEAPWGLLDSLHWCQHRVYVLEALCHGGADARHEDAFRALVTEKVPN